MFYDIYLNGGKVATVGPTTMEHLNVSVATAPGDDKPLLSANGLSPIRKDGHQSYLTWLEHEMNESDTVKIVPSKNLEASDTLRTRHFRRGVTATPEDRFCDFCKQGEEVVGPVIQAGDTPFICARCAELCIEIAKSRGDGELTRRCSGRG